MVRVVLFYMLIFTLSFHVFGQQEFVDLEIHPKNVEIGQSISITLKTNVKGHLDMDMPEEFIQSGAVQSGMSSSIKYINGQQKVVQYNFQSFTGYFEEAGTFIIGPATVSNKKQKYQSESHQIKVSQRQNMISDDPAKNLNQIIFGIIQQSRKEIYEGESIVVEGKVYSQVEILQVDDFTPFTMEVASENHALTNSNQVSSAYEVLNGKNVQTFKIGKSLIFPEKVGKHTIQPFQTTIVYNDWRKIFPERIKVVSNASEIL